MCAPLYLFLFLVRIHTSGTADNAGRTVHHILHMWNINSRHSYARDVRNIAANYAQRSGMSQVQVTQESALWSARTTARGGK